MTRKTRLRPEENNRHAAISGTTQECADRNDAIKISSNWNEIIYIDAFAGPWGSKAEDLSDTSFCIALVKHHDSID